MKILNFEENLFHRNYKYSVYAEIFIPRYLSREVLWVCLTRLGCHPKMFVFENSGSRI
jgi:hypothetical protein